VSAPLDTQLGCPGPVGVGRAISIRRSNRSTQPSIHSPPPWTKRRVASVHR